MTHCKFLFTSFLSLFVFTIIIFAKFHCVNSYRSVFSNSQYSSNNINEQDWQEFEEFREWKRLRNAFSHRITDISQHNGKIILNSTNDNLESISKINWNIIDPPPSNHPALVGRYVVNQASWASVGTISTQKDILTFPFVNVVAISDGPIGNGTGIPYIYIPPIDFTAKDIEVDSRATFMTTLAQGLYCQQESMDPMDPRCARIILSGKIKKIPVDSTEYEFAKNVFFERHPKLINMPNDHHFFFAKLNIAFITVLDTYGGAKFIPVKDYFNPSRFY